MSQLTDNTTRQTNIISTVAAPRPNSRKRHWWQVAGVLLLAVVLLAAIYHYLVPAPAQLQVYHFMDSFFTTELLFYIVVGLSAQLVDGALGMAYGATSSSLLLGLGVSPAVSSASVHVAEVFTTGASGFAHFKLGNVNKKLFLCLLIPGMAGAIIGAYLLSDKINGDLIKPFISAYLLILGVIVIRKGLQQHKRKRKTKRLAPLAFAGGFMDAVGGGGWGPIVTSTLLSKGRTVHYTIGSVNAAEFFVSLSSAATFLIFTGISNWQVVIGLVTGGVIASPFAAILVRKIKRKPLMIMVGVLIILLSLRTIVTAVLHLL
ncbi:sulfite exporter TauE/SafE family protein [Chitinophaga nivalis]|uniref:Probable membrane transporter protein n=1 Tax=Chitinophaga nivalis TaxID=2991709 RepID=A0ABT3IU06_9BACT|nr:sulfite exporter TauE/SafE family protein [Chitinophaga nivalis]MCW3462862.1 sulfite exporter TauE/SafE family protein [Chitinophaga nivalis]MCW3487448.1 sulfite exporter TauE/SafE family protein [Chitinophaga nivalis]